MRHFNPLPRKRENFFRRCCKRIYKHFNPLPRKRENRIVRNMCDLIPSISIHSLVRGRTKLLDRLSGLAVISIHSLVRGRTVMVTDTTSEVSISIHSLVRGRTGRWHMIFNNKLNFNPLPRKRENCKMSQ